STSERPCGWARPACRRPWPAPPSRCGCRREFSEASSGSSWWSPPRGCGRATLLRLRRGLRGRHHRVVPELKVGGRLDRGALRLLFLLGFPSLLVASFTHAHQFL